MGQSDHLRLFYEQCVVIMPARGGSKRVRNKNFRIVDGKELLLYPLETLEQRFSRDQIILSTDSAEIAEIGYTREVNVSLRPAELSGDFVTTVEVVRHEVSKAPKSLDRQYVLTVYPTSAFFSVYDLDRAFRLISQQSSPGVMTLTEFSAPIDRALAVTNDSYASFIKPENASSRTQDMPLYYHDAAQFYLHTTAHIKRNGALIEPSMRYIDFPRNSTVDIDEEIDLSIAEFLLRNRNFKR